MSIRTSLSEDNMDLVMSLVRDMDKNPSEILNFLLNNPDQIISARSKLDETRNRKNIKKQ